jgi:hypothetical protein
LLAFWHAKPSKARLPKSNVLLRNFSLFESNRDLLLSFSFPYSRRDGF